MFCAFAHIAQIMAKSTTLFIIFCPAENDTKIAKTRTLISWRMKGLLYQASISLTHHMKQTQQKSIGNLKCKVVFITVSSA